MSEGCASLRGVINPLNGSGSDNPHTPVINIAGPVVEVANPPTRPQTAPTAAAVEAYDTAVQRHIEMLRQRLRYEQEAARRAFEMLERETERAVMDARHALFPPKPSNGNGVKLPDPAHPLDMSKIFETFFKGQGGAAPPPPASSPTVPSVPIGAGAVVTTPDPTTQVTYTDAAEPVDLHGGTAPQAAAAAATPPVQLVVSVGDAAPGRVMTRAVSDAVVSITWRDDTQFERGLNDLVTKHFRGEITYTKYQEDVQTLEAATLVHAEALTDASGAATFDVPARARVSITVNAPGAPTVEVTEQMDGHADTVEVRVDMPKAWRDANN